MLRKIIKINLWVTNCLNIWGKALRVLAMFSNAVTFTGHIHVVLSPKQYPFITSITLLKAEQANPRCFISPHNIHHSSKSRISQSLMFHYAALVVRYGHCHGSVFT